MENTIETVTLATPVEIDGATVTEIKLRPPKASDLRGLSLGGIVHQEIDQYRILLPRICTNVQLTGDDLDKFSMFDFMEVAATAWLFSRRPESIPPAKA